MTYSHRQNKGKGGNGRERSSYARTKRQATAAELREALAYYESRVPDFAGIPKLRADLAQAEAREQAELAAAKAQAEAERRERNLAALQAMAQEELDRLTYSDRCRPEREAELEATISRILESRAQVSRQLRQQEVSGWVRE